MLDLWTRLSTCVRYIMHRHAFRKRNNYIYVCVCVCVCVGYISCIVCAFESRRNLSTKKEWYSFSFERVLNYAWLDCVSWWQIVTTNTARQTTNMKLFLVGRCGGASKVVPFLLWEVAWWALSPYQRSYKLDYSAAQGGSAWSSGL